MHPFEFLRPSSVDEACRWLAEKEECHPVAGGTAVAILMKQGLFQPQALVNLRDISALNYLDHEPGKGMRIGAMFSQHGLEASPVVKEHFPILASAASKVGNIRVRCQSTVSGTLCEADPQSDIPPVLTALGAVVTIVGTGGSRQVGLEDFVRGHYETVVQPGELVTEVFVPELAPDTAGVYLKHITGPITDRPCLGVAVLLRCDQAGRISFARVVLGGIHGRPWRLAAEEELMHGQEPGAALFEQIADRAYQQAEPNDDLRGSAWYKREMVKVCVRRALEQAAAELKGATL